VGPIVAYQGTNSQKPFSSTRLWLMDLVRDDPRLGPAGVARGLGLDRAEQEVPRFLFRQPPDIVVRWDD